MSTATRDFLYGGMYLSACRFANIDRFVERVGAAIDLAAAADAASAAATLCDLADSMSPDGPLHDDEAALGTLMADDLRAVAAVQVPQAETAVHDRVTAAGGDITARLTGAGLDLGDSDLYVVDDFPAPFDQFGWAAFAPDREDEERYGIPSGVYFRRDGLRPLYSEALFAHEVVHTVPGRVDPEVYAMGLEEGIAEVLGTCFAATAAVPLHALRNILVYGRHGAERPKLWSLYRDHTRQAFLLYQEFGIDGLIELAHRGRAKIHEAEVALFSGTFRTLDLPRGNWDDDTTWLLESFCNGYLPSHVFTPLEVVLIDHVDEQRSLTEICARANVPAIVGVPLLKRLGSESALFVRDGDRIGYSNVQHYLSMGESAGLPVIRYLPPLGKAPQ
ncbi:hypothetical protein F8271_27100 [Micromonospora sp. ALFpr18c]|uniref:hypothetical protein n=1 Tax=unclassified Micromonospora TaxID=2617518 RepID=UPI00124B561C|nr:hypothetical protein [Micromonospora sp. ALFpr18c]KAB1930792.1 hypothetical protein F8271_27100 [Micromonospora sp. ALFpr18c]